MRKPQQKYENKQNHKTHPVHHLPARGLSIAVGSER